MLPILLNFQRWIPRIPSQISSGVLHEPLTSGNPPRTSSEISPGFTCEVPEEILSKNFPRIPLKCILQNSSEIPTRIVSKILTEILVKNLLPIPPKILSAIPLKIGNSESLQKIFLHVFFQGAPTTIDSEISQEINSKISSQWILWVSHKIASWILLKNPPEIPLKNHIESPSRNSFRNLSSYFVLEFIQILAEIYAWFFPVVEAEEFLQKCIRRFP